MPSVCYSGCMCNECFPLVESMSRVQRLPMELAVAHILMFREHVEDRPLRAKEKVFKSRFLERHPSLARFEVSLLRELRSRRARRPA